jgi:mono/diheme cytochrome c family protein
MPTTIARSLLTLALMWAASPGWAQDDAELRRQGQALLATRCSRCHAIASTGDSPHRQAPPFRTLGQKYPVDWLAEALGEGLSTGHPDMPEFVFEPSEITAILTYLQSIQVAKTGPLQRR